MSECKNTCLLSIIIPFYNNEDYLSDSLTSLFEQIDDDVEVVLINDGSTDRSGDVLQQLLTRYPHPHVILINQNNGGIAHARNVGLQHASGQYVTFLDGDDLLSSNYLNTLRPILLSEQYELIDFKYHKFTGKRPEETPSTSLNYSAYDFQQQGMECLMPLFTRSMWHLWNRIFHRSLLVGACFETGRRYEDVIFTPFFYFKTQKIAHVDHELYFYRDNNMGITRNIKEKDIEDMLFAMHKMLHFAAQHRHDESIKQLAAMMVLNCFNEVKSMSKNVYGYYFYPDKVKKILKEAAALCDGTGVPKKKVWQMRYTYIDTFFSSMRWKQKK